MIWIAMAFFIAIQPDDPLFQTLPQRLPGCLMATRSLRAQRLARQQAGRQRVLPENSCLAA